MRRKECKLKSNIWVLKAKSNGLPFCNWVLGQDKENVTEEMFEGILTENFQIGGNQWKEIQVSFFKWLKLMNI